MNTIAISLAALLLGAAQVLTPPFLQNVAADRITILCELDRRCNVAIEYGLSTRYGSRFAAECKQIRPFSYRYRVALSELQPATTYHFRLLVDGIAECEDRSFTTAPPDARPFAFGVWGDSQGTNRGACESDPLAPTTIMLDHMRSLGVDIAVTTGDLSEEGLFFADVRPFYLDRVPLHLGQYVPYFIAWGNHDTGRDNLLRQFADLPSQDRPGLDAGFGSYSFDHAGCHFICIDDDTRMLDILLWLEHDLSSEANRNAKFTFLFVHRPPFCERWIDGESYLRARLVPLMEQYGVDVCFSGHTHEYERGYSNGVYYCITGGGSWLDTAEPIVYDWPHMTVGGAHDLPGHDGGLVNEYLRVEVGEAGWKATMHAFDACGAYLGILDEFDSAHPPQSIDPGPAPHFQCTRELFVKGGEAHAAQMAPDIGVLLVMLCMFFSREARRQ